CVITANDSSSLSSRDNYVYCWGGNENLQAGFAMGNSYPNADAVSYTYTGNTTPQRVTNIIQIHTGDEITCLYRNEDYFSNVSQSEEKTFCFGRIAEKRDGLGNWILDTSFGAPRNHVAQHKAL